MHMEKKIRRAAGAMLITAAACSAALFDCAGSSAMAVFRQEMQETAASDEAQKPLRGLVIAVDAGHGGYDGGAVGRVSGVPEKGINLDVALRVQALLEEAGADVVMTRTGIMRCVTRIRRSAGSCRICSAARR